MTRHGKHHYTSDFEKIDWLLKNQETWTMIRQSDEWWPSPEDREHLERMVKLVKAAGLYSPHSGNKDVMMSVWRKVQHAWKVKQERGI